MALDCILPGYPIRYLNDLIKSTNVLGCLKITADGISYNRSNKTGTVLNRFVIRGKQCPFWNFNSEVPEIYFGFQITDLYSILQGVKKGDTVGFVLPSPDAAFIKINIYVSKKKQGTTPQTTERILRRTQNDSNVEYTDLEFPTHEPNVILSSFQAFGVFGGIKTAGKQRITVRGYKNGIVFATDEEGGGYSFGDVGPEQFGIGNIVPPPSSSDDETQASEVKKEIAPGVFIIPQQRHIIQLNLGFQTVVALKGFRNISSCDKSDKSDDVRFYFDKYDGKIEYMIICVKIEKIGEFMTILRSDQS